jgi:hypothetical protein
MISIEMSERGGRLGNQLFQYAVCKSIALKNGYDYHIPRDFLGVSQLKLKCDLGVESKTVSNTFFQKSEDIHLDIFDIPDNTLISGFFQSEYYFKNIETIIKNDFKLEYCEKSENILKQFNVNEYCYVHLRGGDYKLIDWVLPTEYYNNAKNIITKKNKNIKFLVVTDDIEYSKTIFPNQEYITNDVFTDFYILSKCKFMIMSNSSFSWWTVYLNNNYEHIIGPKRWFNYNKLNRFGNVDNVVPEGIEQEKIIYI